LGTAFLQILIPNLPVILRMFLDFHAGCDVVAPVLCTVDRFGRKVVFGPCVSRTLQRTKDAPWIPYNVEKICVWIDLQNELRDEPALGRLVDNNSRSRLSAGNLVEYCVGCMSAQAEKLISRKEPSKFDRRSILIVLLIVETDHETSPPFILATPPISQTSKVLHEFGMLKNGNLRMLRQQQRKPRGSAPRTTNDKNARSFIDGTDG
jgi:hypothetical protein